ERAFRHRTCDHAPSAAGRHAVNESSAMVASSEILAGLRASAQPLQMQAALAAISEGEAGDKENRLYGGGVLRAPGPNIQTDAKGRLWVGSLDTFPDWKGARLSNGLISTALGGWQVTKTTHDDYAAQFGVSDFHLAGQIDFSAKLAILRFNHATGG